MKLLILPLLVISLPYTSGNATEPVYDTEGKELSSQSDYYILPARRAIGGGLNFIPTSSRCLYFVVQERNETFLGAATVRFTPHDASAGNAIRLSNDVGIQFIGFPNEQCMKYLDWQLADRSPEPPSMRRKHVVAGHLVESAPPSTKVFRIERHDAEIMEYKLVSCPDKSACTDLSLHIYKDKKWLAVLGDEPLVVVFRKA